MRIAFKDVCETCLATAEHPGLIESVLGNDDRKILIRHLVLNGGIFILELLEFLASLKCHKRYNLFRARPQFV